MGVSDSDIHMINQSVQIDTDQASSTGSHDKVQDQGQASGSINYQYSNLLALQEIIHWT
jgi:hypothetical protein